MLVRKFGGTSMGSAESLENVAAIVKKYRDKQVVVVSAMSGTTNKLLELGQLALVGKRTAVKKIIDEILTRHVSTAEEMIRNEEIRGEAIRYFEKKLSGFSGFLKALGEIGEISPRSHDKIIATGEQLSSRLLAAILTDGGMPVEQLDLEKAIPEKFERADHKFFLTVEKTFGKLTKKILAKKKIPVATGYFGHVPGGMIPAVGRGYSDFCAALLAAGGRASKLEIWTDVSGILTADPRKVDDAVVIQKIMSETAAELAHFGAKVLHPQSIHPAVRAKIPVWIKNTFAPRDHGTQIVRDLPRTSCKNTAVTCKKDILVVHVASYRMLLQHGFLARVFEVFDRFEIPVDVVATSEVSISLAFPAEFEKVLPKIFEELQPFAKVSLEKKKAIVCLIGLSLQHKVGTAGRAFGVLGRNKINIEMISQGANEINITCVIDERDADKAVKVLHSEFHRKPKK